MSHRNNIVLRNERASHLVDLAITNARCACESGEWDAEGSRLHGAPGHSREGRASRSREGGKAAVSEANGSYSQLQLLLNCRRGRRRDRARKVLAYLLNILRDASSECECEGGDG